MMICGSTDEQLIAAHLLPVQQRELLHDPSQCRKFNIGSIMDAANGILLCWSFHRCFAANLACIDADTGELFVAAALLRNKPEKWGKLVGRAVPAASYAWPFKPLLELRQKAMQGATEKKGNFGLFCLYCSKGYKRVHALRNHEATCTDSQQTLSSYLTPALKGPSDSVGDDQVDDL